jgi:spore cortex formation protein SpoVR/YcgB (stage V sporulation)
MKKRANPFSKVEWSSKDILDMWDVIRNIAVKKYSIDFYDPLFEIVTWEDMLHIHAGSFPVWVDHWTIGVEYEKMLKQYQGNQMGVAYEVIFNTSPSLCYILNTNSTAMQALVLAHAAVGHSSFFKNNHLFKQYTKAENAISLFKQFRTNLSIYEEEALEKKYRITDLFEQLLPLQFYGISFKNQSVHTSKEVEANSQKIREALNKEFSISIDSLGLGRDVVMTQKSGQVAPESLSILDFIAEHSPTLPRSARNVIKSYAEIGRYFYPQMMTKMLNEGWASFWHHQLTHDLFEEGWLDEGRMMEILHSHTCVVRHNDSEMGVNFNPYHLGYNLLHDIKRICTKPTDEDRHYFPDLVETNWLDAVKDCCYNFSDSTAVSQFLSPKLVRDYKLMATHIKTELVDHGYRGVEESKFYNVDGIHDDEGFKMIRRILSDKYNFYDGEKFPLLEVGGFNRTTKRLTLNAHLNASKTMPDIDKMNLQRSIENLWDSKGYFKIHYKEFDVKTGRPIVYSDDDGA